MTVAELRKLLADVPDKYDVYVETRVDSEPAQSVRESYDTPISNGAVYISSDDGIYHGEPLT